MALLKEFAEISPDIIAELIGRLANILNWRIVRGLGELQILTKASYIALIIGKEKGVKSAFGLCLENKSQKQT